MRKNNAANSLLQLAARMRRAPVAVIGLICWLARINNFKHGDNKRTKRKNKRKGFRSQYVYGQYVLGFVMICQAIFVICFISSPVFRVKFFDFCLKIDPCRIEIEDQKKYGKGAEYYNQNNLSFADRRKRCDCDDNPVQSNEGRP